LRLPSAALGLATALVTVCVLGTVLVAPRAYAAPPAARPAAVVALGDSFASGEGGGNYAAGTRGEKGDWCHRSPSAYVQRTGLPGKAINLACSGAKSSDIAFGGSGHYTEGSQAQRLIDVARANQVSAVLVQVGANDDPAFGSSVVGCVATFLTPGSPACSTTLKKNWAQRLAAMAPRVERALADVRTAMSRAGYNAQDYQLVLMSYPSPLTETMTRTHGIAGCPFRVEDARWGRTVAAPQLSDALRGVAQHAGARFLDLSRAAEGHEACTTAGPEWVRRLTIAPRSFVSGGLAAAGHLAQESFHPNALGYGRLATCVGQFVRAADREAACRVGTDGLLHLTPSAAPTAAPVTAG
jgi:lysophospholipase L1-like esterase